MATRTISEGYFGSTGLGDTMSSFCEKTLMVSWDFSKKNVAQAASSGTDTVVPLMQLPKGFCAEHIAVVQTKAVAKDLAVTFGVASTDAFTVGGTFTLDDATMLRSMQDADATNHTARFLDGNDVLCMIVPKSSTTTAATIAAGAFDLCVKGYEVFAEGPTENTLGADNYRIPLQTAADVAANKSDDTGGQWPLD